MHPRRRRSADRLRVLQRTGRDWKANEERLAPLSPHHRIRLRAAAQAPGPAKGLKCQHRRTEARGEKYTRSTHIHRIYSKHVEIYSNKGAVIKPFPTLRL